MTDYLDMLHVKAWLEEHRQKNNQIHVSLPREVACWTRASKLDGGRLMHNDRSGLKPYTVRSMSPPIDLNEGYPDRYVAKAEGVHPGVEPVLDAVLRAGALRDCDVCTFRNNLNKIGGTPIDPRQEWQMDATWHGGCLYLDIRDNPGERRTFPDAERFQYYGYKFEAVCTEGPAEPAEEPALVDATSEYCAVMRIRVGDTRIVMAAEVDCCSEAPSSGREAGGADIRIPSPLPSPPPAVSSNYLEIKTHRVPARAPQERTLRRLKYPKWWLQSWLAGIEHIVVGAWDDGGLLRQARIVRTTDLPKLSAAGGDAWDPWLCIKFLKDTLQWMGELCKRHRGAHLRFTYDARSGSVHAEMVRGGELPGRVESMIRAHETSGSEGRAGPPASEGQDRADQEAQRKRKRGVGTGDVDV